MKKNNYNSYFKKAGQKIVDLNNQAVDAGVGAAVAVEIPGSWADVPDAPAAEISASSFVKDIVIPMQLVPNVFLSLVVLALLFIAIRNLRVTGWDKTCHR